MAKILALDTSTAACSVAVACDGDIEESFVVAPQDHTQRLLPMVDDLLTKRGVKLKDLDCIAFAAGPGSFTGLRICLGVVQGLAFGATLPVVAVSSLAATAASAHRLLDLPRASVLIPAFDARMDEVYWGVYGEGEQGLSLTPLRDDAVNPPSSIQDELNSLLSGKDIIAVGDGWRCSDMPRPLASCIEEEAYPHAFDVAVLGERLFASGQGVSALEASPTYIRNEVSWKKRQKLRS